MDETNTPKESVTYQRMLETVEEIVQQLTSSGDRLDLDEMVKKVEQGYDLIRKMREKLSATKEKVEKLRLEFEQSTKQESP